MLIVRAEQLRALSELELNRFRAHVIQTIRLRFGEETRTFSDEGLSAFVNVGIDEARKHGVTQERDVEEFIGLAFALGVDFNASQHSWIRQVLKQNHIDWPRRRDLIIERLAFGENK